MFVNVIVDAIDVLCEPISKIYNKITETKQWPAQWKTEHVTIIPKTSCPESEAQCRNISCTNYLSKVFERFVLRWCQQFVSPKANQFGGQKGCSTYHFLAETWDDITDHLEDLRAASVLTAIDYSKAFNRVEHLPLLNTFTNKGMPTQLIQILAGFLSKRTMSVKLGMARSDPRPVNAGAPQGSVLGTYVFDELEEAADLVHDAARENYELNEDDLAFLETETGPQNAHSTPIRDHAAVPLPAVSPVQNDSLNFVVLNTARNIPPNLTNCIEPSWRSKLVNIRNFVDDNLQTEKLSLSLIHI